MSNLRTNLHLQAQLGLLAALMLLRCGRGKAAHAAAALGAFSSAQEADAFIDHEAGEFTKLSETTRQLFQQNAPAKRERVIQTFRTALQEAGLVPTDDHSAAEAELKRLEHGLPHGRTEDGAATLYGFTRLADRTAELLGNNKSSETATAVTSPTTVAPISDRLAALRSGLATTYSIPTNATPVPGRTAAATATTPTLGIVDTTTGRTLTFEEMGELVMPFGKFKGRRIADLLNSRGGQSYLKRLALSTTNKFFGRREMIVDGINYTRLAGEVLREQVRRSYASFNTGTGTATGATTTATTPTLPPAPTPAPAIPKPPLPDFLNPATKGEGTSGEGSLDGYSGSFKSGLVEGDPINNEGMRRMLGGIASSLTGKPRKVVFKEGGGFATDMSGTIYLDPYPLGKTAPHAHNLAVMVAGMTHELGHELHTDPDHWRSVLAAAQATSDEAVEARGLNENGRRLITHVYNIIEDGRMEREVSQLAGSAEHLALGCKLQPRWDETVGEGISTSHQVYGAMLYTSLPYFKVRPEVRAAMSSASRALFEELEPVVRRGVLGGQEEALEAAFTIARRLQTEKFGEPPKELDVRPPADPDNLEHNGSGGGKSSSSSSSKSPKSGSQTSDHSKSQTQDKGEKTNGDGKGEGETNGDGKDENKGKGKTNGEGEGKGKGEKDAGGSGTGSGSSDKKSEEEGKGGKVGAQYGNQNARKYDKEAENSANTSSSAGGGVGASAAPTNSEQPPIPPKPPQPKPQDNEDSTATPNPHSETETSTDWEIDDKTLENAFNALEREAAYEVGGEVRRQSRVEGLGGKLHQPLTRGNDDPQTQHYLDYAGRPVSTEVDRPTKPILRFQDRRPAQKKKGHELATYLRRIKQTAEQRLDMQNRGKLDRGRFVQAVKGARDVYSQTAPGQKKTAMAVSISLDQSGSMKMVAQQGKLFDAAMIISDALEELDMPYEVRGFEQKSRLYKSFGDHSFDPYRAECLTDAPGGWERLDLACGLATTSLAARPETNKLEIFMTDGLIGNWDKDPATGQVMTNYKRSVLMLSDARKRGVVPFGIFFENGREADEKKLDELYGKGGWVAIKTLDSMPQVVGSKIAEIFRNLR